MRRKIIIYAPHLKTYARRLRKKCTQSEALLWKSLKGKQLKGFAFHRQKPIDNYIADFYCHELKLVLELDGITHTFPEVIRKDRIKQKRLESLGLTVLRFKDEEIFSNLDAVIKRIEIYINNFKLNR
jgi:very-short-patch-repair endonuclease